MHVPSKKGASGIGIRVLLQPGLQLQPCAAAIEVPWECAGHLDTFPSTRLSVAESVRSSVSMYFTRSSMSLLIFVVSIAVPRN